MGARSLRRDRALARARLLHSDRAGRTLGRYVATELWLELGRYLATERDGRSVLLLDPSHPGRASVTAMVSSRCGKLAGTLRSIRDSWDALQLSTLHRCVSLTKSRICSSRPWYLGYAPTQPDPPQSPACFLPRVSVVTTTWSNLVAAATNNTSTQTSSRRPLGVKDRRFWLSHYRSVSARYVFLRGNPLIVSPPFNYIHQPYHPSSIPSTPSGIARVRPLSLRKSFRQAMP
ncbi:hypothetical protein F2Q69_00010366 [Brassica cretica]|uniref:Uncharacterized protein n=1 Tax=Brassica cretica TaxID=69181 RepID=A0A8S9QRH8_BRACR|nr:hypothetical protein F2Q69_00010366 [Brassica cretica]